MKKHEYEKIIKIIQEKEENNTNGNEILKKKYEEKFGKLYKRNKEGRLMKVLKKDEIDSVLWIMHNHPTGGHFGTENIYRKIKERLCTTPVLAYPDFKKEFILYTDASGYALGAVLSQKDEDEKEHVIYYASKSLTDAEKNYSTTELECYAVVWAVEKFHYYLDGKKFKVITDHYALKWLEKNALKGRRARWILRLQPYFGNMEIIYKEGRKHRNADALSRIKG